MAYRDDLSDDEGLLRPEVARALGDRRPPDRPVRREYDLDPLPPVGCAIAVLLFLLALFGVGTHLTGIGNRRSTPQIVAVPPPTTVPRTPTQRTAARPEPSPEIAERKPEAAALPRRPSRRVPPRTSGVVESERAAAVARTTARIGPAPRARSASLAPVEAHAGAVSGDGIDHRPAARLRTPTASTSPARPSYAGIPAFALRGGDPRSDDERSPREACSCANRPVRFFVENGPIPYPPRRWPPPMPPCCPPGRPIHVPYPPPMGPVVIQPGPFPGYAPWPPGAFVRVRVVYGVRRGRAR